MTDKPKRKIILKDGNANSPYPINKVGSKLDKKLLPSLQGHIVPLCSKKAALGINEDKRLMLLAREGDWQAFEKLYRKWFPYLRGFFSKRNVSNTAALDELVQETFFRLWKLRENFLKNSSYEGFMFGIALNVLREHRAGIIREKKLDYSQFMSLISGQTDNMSAPENTAHNKDIADILIRAMAKLTVKQRQALELVYIQGFSQAEGAKIAGCTSWVFYSRLYNAKKRLTRLLSHLKT